MRLISYTLPGRRRRSDQADELLQGALLTVPSEWIHEWPVAREPHLSGHGGATEHVLHGWLSAISLRRCAYDQKDFYVLVNACIHTGGVSLEGISNLQAARASETAQSLLILCVRQTLGLEPRSAHARTHTHTHTYTHTHTHTHIHTHTYDLKRLSSTGTYGRYVHTWQVQQLHETHSS